MIIGESIGYMCEKLGRISRTFFYREMMTVRSYGRNRNNGRKAIKLCRKDEVDSLIQLIKENRMPRTYRSSNQLELVHRSTISMGLFTKQLTHINRQYHDYNELQLIIDGTGQLVKVPFSDEYGHQSQFTDWLEPIETRRYLHNFEQLFCLDLTRLDLFFELSDSSN